MNQNETGRVGGLPHQPVELTAILTFLDAMTQTAYNTMRGIGFSIDAAKDAITVHVSDTLVPLAQAEHQLAEERDEGGGGVPAERSP